MVLGAPWRNKPGVEEEEARCDEGKEAEGKQEVDEESSIERLSVVGEAVFLVSHAPLCITIRRHLRVDITQNDQPVSKHTHSHHIHPSSRTCNVHRWSSSMISFAAEISESSTPAQIVLKFSMRFPIPCIYKATSSIATPPPSPYSINVPSETHRLRHDHDLHQPCAVMNESSKSRHEMGDKCKTRGLARSIGSIERSHR